MSVMTEVDGKIIRPVQDNRLITVVDRSCVGTTFQHVPKIVANFEW